MPACLCSKSSSSNVMFLFHKNDCGSMSTQISSWLVNFAPVQSTRCNNAFQLSTSWSWMFGYWRLLGSVDFVKYYTLGWFCMILLYYDVYFVLLRSKSATMSMIIRRFRYKIYMSFEFFSCYTLRLLLCNWDHCMAIEKFLTWFSGAEKARARLPIFGAISIRT